MRKQTPKKETPPIPPETSQLSQDVAELYMTFDEGEPDSEEPPTVPKKGSNAA
jgi:hypothetical protein